MFQFAAINAMQTIVQDQKLIDILSNGTILRFPSKASDYPKAFPVAPDDLVRFAGSDQLSKKDKKGRNVIQIAVANKKVNPTVVEKLVELLGSAKVADLDNIGDNIFHLAAQCRTLPEDDAIFRLLKDQAVQSAYVLNRQNAKGQTPLLVAVMHDNLIAFRHLSDFVTNYALLLTEAAKKKSYYIFAEIIERLRVPPPAYDVDAPPPYSPIAASNVIELLLRQMQKLLAEKPTSKGFFGGLFASKPKDTREQKLDTVVKALGIALAEKDTYYHELHYALNERDNAILSDGELGRSYQAAVVEERRQQQRPPAVAPEVPTMIKQ